MVKIEVEVEMCDFCPNYRHEFPDSVSDHVADFIYCAKTGEVIAIRDETPKENYDLVYKTPGGNVWNGEIPEWCEYRRKE